MFITDKDLDLSLRFIFTPHFNQSNVPWLFIIPDINNNESGWKYALYENCNQPVNCVANKEIKEYFSEYIAPNYIDFVRVKEDKDTPVFSERFDVIFDVDEDIVFYYKLKFC